MKKYRVFVERPGAGWESIVVAMDTRGVHRQMKRRRLQDSGYEMVEVPWNYEKVQAEKDRRKLDMNIELDRAEQHYITEVTRIRRQYGDY